MLGKWISVVEAANLLNDDFLQMITSKDVKPFFNINELK